MDKSIYEQAQDLFDELYKPEKENYAIIIRYRNEDWLVIWLDSEQITLENNPHGEKTKNIDIYPEDEDWQELLEAIVETGHSRIY